MNENYLKYKGLSSADAKKAADAGLINESTQKSTRSAYAIIASNLCTLFNLVNFILALLLFYVGSYKNMLFMGVVISNLLIGVVQELRAKKAVDDLSLMNAAKANVIRDSKLMEIASDMVVQGDLIVFSQGDEVCADCVCIEGGCEADESFITGESEGVNKKAGSTLLAGSHIVSGNILARAEKVGHDTYIAGIARGAKKYKKPYSTLMTALKKIVVFSSAIIIPVGVLLFRSQYLIDANLKNAVEQTVGALIGMIPEGLMLLTSTALCLGVIRLSSKKILVRELYSIESLARSDIVCFDKTGTLTTGKMQLSALLPMEGKDAQEASALIAKLMGVLLDDNPTAKALREAFGQEKCAAEEILPFSPKTKFSGARIDGFYYVIGAPDVIVSSKAQRLEALSKGGQRVLMLAKCDLLDKDGFPKDAQPIAYITLRDEIRKGAHKTVSYFYSQDMDVRVISGDSVKTVCEIAKRCGVKGYEKAVDIYGMSDDELKRIAESTVIFGRANPEQKKTIVKILRSNGHVVCMTGDGVNDVPAMREADCSAAVASGTEAARGAAHLVLAGSDFDSLPSVVNEGRRCINNITRSASLFLAKTVYATVLAIAFVFIDRPYPFMAVQMTLINGAAIGIPSFLLALEPSFERVKKGFLSEVLERVLPAALLVIAGVLGISLIGGNYFPDESISTMCVMYTAFVSMLLLIRVAMPMNIRRGALAAAMILLFILQAAVLPGFYSVSKLAGSEIKALAVLMAAAAAVYVCVLMMIERYKNRGIKK